MAAVLLRGLGPGVERGLAEVELHEHGESDGGESDGDRAHAPLLAPLPGLAFLRGGGAAQLGLAASPDAAAARPPPAAPLPTGGGGPARLFRRGDPRPSGSSITAARVGPGRGAGAGAGPGGLATRAAPALAPTAAPLAVAVAPTVAPTVRARRAWAILALSSSREISSSSRT